MQEKRGINHGVTVATHLFSDMGEFNHREPGIIGADKTVLVSDATRASGLKDGEYELGRQKVIVNNGAAPLENGGLAGSTLNLKNAVYNMVAMLNIPIQDAVRMTSLSPAKAIGVWNFKGSIEVGKDADMLLFDDDINIFTIFSIGLSSETLISYKILPTSFKM